MRKSTCFFLVCLITIILPASFAYASHPNSEGKVRVTITNLTGNIQLTPVLVASPAYLPTWFEVGSAASPQVAALAEGGDTQPLLMQLKQAGVLKDSMAVEGLLAPGQSASVVVAYDRAHAYLSIGAMLLPTNDAFIGLSNWRIPFYGFRRHTLLPAYDAGSETNDELCMHIPGPRCAGVALSDGDGEGYIYPHPGIVGVGDLDARKYAWKNPVAKISVQIMR